MLSSYVLAFAGGIVGYHTPSRRCSGRLASLDSILGAKYRMMITDEGAEAFIAPHTKRVDDEARLRKYELLVIQGKIANDIPLYPSSTQRAPEEDSVYVRLVPQPADNTIPYDVLMKDRPLERRKRRNDGGD